MVDKVKLKEWLKFALEESGGLFVMMVGMTVMPEWLVGSWDTAMVMVCNCLLHYFVRYNLSYT